MFRVLTSMLQSGSSDLDHTPLPVAVWWVPSSEVRAAAFQFFPFKMMMTWPPFRINLHELNNTSTLWVFVEGSESSKAKRGNENCPLCYSGQIHQLIICTVQFASASEITPFGTSVVFQEAGLGHPRFVACRLVSKSDKCLHFRSTLNWQPQQGTADSPDAYGVCRFVSFTQSTHKHWPYHKPTPGQHFPR